MEVLVLPTLVLPFDMSILTDQIKESSRKQYGGDIATFLAYSKTAASINALRLAYLCKKSICATQRFRGYTELPDIPELLITSFK